MVFSLSSLWWRLRGLWKHLDGRDWLRGRLGLVLMGGAMLSKSLIQFSVDGWSCVPSLLFIWGLTMVEVMKIMATSFKRSCAHTATLPARDSAVGRCWPMPPPETPGHSRASLCQSLVGSLLLSPGSWCTQVSVCVLQESVSQTRVCFGSSVVGLMVTFSKRAYATPRSAAPRAPAPAAGHCWPGPPQETLKRVLSQSLCGLWVLVGTGLVWALQVSLAVCCLILNVTLPFLPSWPGLLLCPWTWGISS